MRRRGDEAFAAALEQNTVRAIVVPHDEHAIAVERHRPAHVPLPRASAQSISADARLDRAGGSASKGDNHFAELRLTLQKNRRSPAPVFSPSM